MLFPLPCISELWVVKRQIQAQMFAVASDESENRRKVFGRPWLQFPVLFFNLFYFQFRLTPSTFHNASLFSWPCE